MAGDPKEGEVDDEGPGFSRNNPIDWAALLKAAEDPELADLLASPVDSAMKILKEGREIQKITIIRSVRDLLESDAEECMTKVLPMIQTVLTEEMGNLDLHCEAAVAFRNLICNNKFTEKYSGLSELLLVDIVQNGKRQRDNLSAAAWLETLSDVVDHIPLSAVRQSIVPVALAQAESTQRVQRRVIATKLIEKLSTILPPIDVRQLLLPSVQMLTQDPNPNVRSSMAQRLAVIAKGMDVVETSSLLMSSVIELCKDDDCGVREAMLNTIADLLKFFDKENQRNALVPLIRRCCEQALLMRDETLLVVAKQLGMWCYSMQEILSVNDRKWFLDVFCKLATGDDRGEQALQVACRRLAAYNFPCMMSIFGGECFVERLQPIHERFCTDADDEVRKATAAGFHEVVKLSSDEQRPDLIPAFIELIRASESEVVGHLAGNLHLMLPSLYGCLSSTNPRRSQLDRIVIGCNRLIRGTGNWRAHEAYLTNLSCLIECIDVEQLFISFVPLLKGELLTVRAIPCRLAAATTLLRFLRLQSSAKQRSIIIDFFHSVGKHQNCHRRALYLDIVPIVIRLFSRSFFKEHFLDAALAMEHDKVTNIRLKLCKLLSSIKRALVLPADEEILQRLESIVKNFLGRDEKRTTRQLIQMYAYELSRAETAEDSADAMKEADEKRLWIEDNDFARNKKTLDAEKAKESSTKKPPPGTSTTSTSTPNRSSTTTESSSTSTTPWRVRTQRPQMAIVRPQPQVVVVQRSPSPMPKVVDSNRKSRLPLPASPTTSTAEKFSPTKGPRVSLIDQSSFSSGRVRMHDVNGPPLPSKSPTSTSWSNNNNDGYGLRRSATTNISSSSRPGLMSSLSSSNIRRSPHYGLIKVHSSSAINRKPYEITKYHVTIT